MSIQIVGPAQYEYQYLCALYIALSFFEQPTFKIEVEPEEGEDARLHLNGKTIDIQVKGEDGPITSKHLAKWLMHFPEHKATNPLLSKLIVNDDRIVVFCLKKRVADTLAPLLKDIPWDGNAHSGIKLTIKEVSDIFLDIPSLFKKTKLEQERQKE